jgi:hypothetical protein
VLVQVSGQEVEQGQPPWWAGGQARHPPVDGAGFADEAQFGWAVQLVHSLGRGSRIGADGGGCSHGWVAVVVAAAAVVVPGLII